MIRQWKWRPGQITVEYFLVFTLVATLTVIGLTKFFESKDANGQRTGVMALFEQFFVAASGAMK